MQIGAPSERHSGQDRADLRTEHSIATSRLLLASAGLVTVWIGPAPSDWPVAVYAALGSYAVFATLCAIVLRVWRRVMWAFGAATHLVDIGVATMVTLLTDGHNSPFFVFLNFPLLTAAYRWGLQETLSTVVTAVALLAIESTLLSGREPAAASFDAFVAPTPALRVVYLVVVGFLVGYLSDAEKRRRAEALALSRMLGVVRVGRSLDEALHDVLKTLARLFRARGAWLVMQDVRKGRTFICGTRAKGSGPASTMRELSAGDGDRHLRALPGAALHGVRRLWSRRRWRAVAIDGEGGTIDASGADIPDGCVPGDSCRRVIVTTQTFGGHWTARVFVTDPAFFLDREEAARILQRTMAHLGPAVFEHYRLHRLRERASLAERRRIVRELHDGPMQSLLGVEMELAVLRRSARDRAPQLEPDLARFHDTLKREVVGLREVFEGVRAGTSSIQPIQEDMTDMVTRFAIYTGLDARFEGNDLPVVLPPTERREVLRIVHEALANSRKHSGARRVVVRAHVRGDQFVVQVDDNGKGFPWAGTRTDAELRADGRGPWSILDRLTMLNGTLTITSRPGAGCSVELACRIPVLRRALA